MQKELDSIKVKKEAAAERLEKLSDTTNQIKKYYVKLKTEVNKSETEVSQSKYYHHYIKIYFASRRQINLTLKKVSIILISSSSYKTL